MDATLTVLERRLLLAATRTEFGDAREEPVWVFACFDVAVIDPKIGRGVVSSLEQKGLVVVQDWEGDERILKITDAGKKAIEQ